MYGELDLNYYLAKPKNSGWFPKGHVPANKGKKWSEWLPKRKQNKIRKLLLKTRQNGNPNLGGQNARPVVRLDNDNKFVVFKSSADAGRCCNVCARNIINVCRKKRKKCGGYRWFYEDDKEWLKVAKLQ